MLKAHGVLIVNHFLVFLATGFGLGSATFWFFQRIKLSLFFYMPRRWTGAGLAGSLFALFLVWMGARFQGWGGFAVLFLLTLFSIFITDRAEKILGEKDSAVQAGDSAVQAKDDPRIILDEMIGFFWATAFLPIPYPAKEKGFLLLFAFLFFRIFDVFKLPFPQAQKLKGGIGLMADDVLAGMLANLLTQFFARFILMQG